MRNIQSIIFIWTRTYSKVLKSALVYLSEKTKSLAEWSCYNTAHVTTQLISYEFSVVGKKVSKLKGNGLTNCQTLKKRSNLRPSFPEILHKNEISH